jgi:hypothetical protein
MLAVAERRARPKDERFDRPLRDGRVFLRHFPSTSYWATFIGPSNAGRTNLTLPSYRTTP